jgi:hypothetical protein
MAMAQSGATVELFENPSEAALARHAAADHGPASDNPAARYKIVRVDLGALELEPEEIILRPFSNLRLTLQRTRVTHKSGGGFDWHGKVAGDDESFAVLTHSPDGFMIGTIKTATTVYRIWFTDEPPYHVFWELLPRDENRPKKPLGCCIENVDGPPRSAEEYAEFERNLSPPPPELIEAREAGLKRMEEIERERAAAEDAARREAASRPLNPKAGVGFINEDGEVIQYDTRTQPNPTDALDSQE